VNFLLDGFGWVFAEVARLDPDSILPQSTTTTAAVSQTGPIVLVCSVDRERLTA